MNTSSIEFFIQANPVLTYAIIFLGMLVEGEGIALLASVFAWHALLSWPILAIVIMAGVICGDVLWFLAGRHLKGTRLGAWLDKRYEKTGEWVVERIMTRYHWYAILSKFMYFTTRPTIFLAGWHDYNFKKFLKITAYATAIWTTIMLGVGYFFGYTISLIGFKKITHRIELFALAVFVGIFLLEWLINRLVVKRVRRIGPTSPVKIQTEGN